MDDALDAGEDSPDEGLVADVAKDELVARVVLDVVQVVEVPGVGQLVQVDDPRRRMAAEDHPNKMTADKARPARHENRLAVEGPLRTYGHPPVPRIRIPPKNRAFSRWSRGPARP